MKKLIATLTLAILLIPTLALAESVNVFGSGNVKYLFTTTDDGEVRSSTAHKTSTGWWIVDDQGNSTTINNYSSDRDRDWNSRERDDD
jgi:hypothetical protein